MNKKIRLLRESIGLTETEISRFLNISSYKYVAFENNQANISLDILALISLIYNIPIDIIINPKYTKNDLLLYLQNHSSFHLSKEQTIKKITYNLTGNEGKNISYRNINLLKKKIQKNIINNINKIIEEKSISTTMLANQLGIEHDSLESILLKKRFLTTNEVIKISQEFSISASVILFE